MINQHQGNRYKEIIFSLSNLHQHREVTQRGKKIGLDNKLNTLRTWQSERLVRTHADLLASRRYGPACKFFLEDIYSPRDHSPRDRDFEHLYRLMSNILPDFLLTLARKAIEINDLTNALDQVLLKVLVEELGMNNRITTDIYTEAYRRCDNYEERVHQVDLLFEIGRGVDFATRLPLVGTTLRLARGPARRAGWHEMQDFFERGYKVFKQMRGVKPILETIYRREMRILDRIYAGDSDTFSISVS